MPWSPASPLTIALTRFVASSKSRISSSSPVSTADVKSTLSFFMSERLLFFVLLLESSVARCVRQKSKLLNGFDDLGLRLRRPAYRPHLTRRSSFVLIGLMEELPYKIVRMYGPRDEVVARVDNLEICKAAFEKALFVYPNQHLELRQGARIILKSKEQPSGASEHMKEADSEQAGTGSSRQPQAKEAGGPLDQDRRGLP